MAIVMNKAEIILKIKSNVDNETHTQTDNWNIACYASFYSPFCKKQIYQWLKPVEF